MRLERLLAITMLLLNRRRISAKELSERFEVSLRTIYRDVDSINQAGIPVISYAGATGGYELMDRYGIDRQHISLDELQSIIIALNGVQGIMDEHHVAGLLDKVGALLTTSEQGDVERMSNAFMIDLNPWHSAEDEQDRLHQIRVAARDRRVVAFVYTDNYSQMSERHVELHSIVLKGYVWYAYGYCRLREDFRTFRLSRIRDIQVTDETFEPREDRPQQPDLLRRHPGERSRYPLIEMKLRFAPTARARVLDFCSSDQIETETNGYMRVTASMPDDPWLIGFLLSLGANVEILSPVRLSERVQAEAAKIVALYSKAGSLLR
ncbi:helix-turn-helix transcriptional regulator [Paenibacillus kobensis]|uniref:helix-turn-helix transcriptional regulator n=1 Tax=Paenibacillus kobensis TaxID=59841 RepID=UPI000FD8F8A2|nr:YafY family protein [Paenibacillus kobensis]